MNVFVYATKYWINLQVKNAPDELKAPTHKDGSFASFSGNILGQNR